MLDIAPFFVAGAFGALLVSAAAGLASLALRVGTEPLAEPIGGPSPPPFSQAAQRAERVSLGSLWAGLAALLVALGLRALGIGHAPWSNLYEVSQAIAAAVLISYLLLARSFELRPLTPVVAGIAGLLVLHAISLPSVARPLVPALQQPALLTVHVGTAVAAYGIYAVALAAAAGELLQRTRAAAAWLPSAEVCRAAAHRAVVLGYPILTAAIVLGAVWANLAWRSYWNNDPKELTAAATWLIYGAYLHVAGRRDRWGRAAPWLIVAGFGGILLTYFGANLLFPGQHSYTGV